MMVLSEETMTTTAFVGAGSRRRSRPGRRGALFMFFCCCVALDAATQDFTSVLHHRTRRVAVTLLEQEFARAVPRYNTTEILTRKGRVVVLSSPVAIVVQAVVAKRLRSMEESNSHKKTGAGASSLSSHYYDSANRELRILRRHLVVACHGQQRCNDICAPTPHTHTRCKLEMQASAADMSNPCGVPCNSPPGMLLPATDSAKYADHHHPRTACSVRTTMRRWASSKEQLLAPSVQWPV
jgi:hypothetical protein